MPDLIEKCESIQDFVVMPEEKFEKLDSLRSEVNIFHDHL
jgi:hypothetical protein